jgi:hypothetical protein
MAGDETQDYDLVLEFTESVYREVFGALFDADGVLCDVLTLLDERVPFFPTLPCGAFTAEILFDRPTDVEGLPGAPADTVDVRMELGEDGTDGNLRFVAGVDVDSSDPDLDLVRVNLAEKTYHASATILGVTDTVGAFQTLLEELGHLPLLPVPVDRDADSSTQLTGANVRVIDDGSPEDRDAVGLLLTFGGGTEGNRDGFTRSFLVPGDRGGIVVDFDWLCRIVRPRLAAALEVPADAFDPPCRLNRTVTVDEEEDVDLTALELTLVDGAIQVNAAVRKDGTGYAATGDVTARILMRVEDGSLVLRSEIDDPDIDVDLDWWVWLTAGVLGGIIGGVIAGVIGAVVGAVLVPLLTWLATDIIEGLVENIASKVTDAVGSLNVEVPAVGLNLLFQEVFVDDIVVQTEARVEDTAPVRASGTITVADGQRVDLDNGVVGGETLSGADLLWEGTDAARRLRTLCEAAVARIGSRSFEGFTRYSLYELGYETPTALPLRDLAERRTSWLESFGVDRYREHRRVYGVRTDEERYALVQAIRVTDDDVTLRYRTYEKHLPECTVMGGFSYEVGGIERPTDHLLGADQVREATRVFTPDARAAPAGTGDQVVERPDQAVVEAALARRPDGPRRPTGPGGGTVPPVRPRPPRGPDSPDIPDIPDVPDRPETPDQPEQPEPIQPCEPVKTGPSRLPKYEVPVSRRVKRGRFVARTRGLSRPLTVRWSFDGETLDDDGGRVSADGVEFDYRIVDGELVLTPDGTGDAEFDLDVEVEADDGTTVSCSRCVEVVGQKTVRQRGTLHWTAYKREFAEALQVVEREA